MIWTNVKYIRRSLIAAFAALLMASVPLFSSPDHNALIRSAAAMPSANSLRMLDSLSRVQGAAGAQALRLLGDHAFIKEDYKKAAAFYRQASQSDNLSIYRHLHALAAALDDQTAAAKEIWNTIAENLSDPLSALAALHLAYLEMQARNWTAAYAILQSAAPADTASPLYIPFVWEMLECSKEMRSSERVAFHERQLAAFRGHILESSTASIQSAVSASTPNNRQSGNAAASAANVNTERPQAAAVSTPQTQQRANFTIQVGAFGSRDNAENLVRRLSENYSDVTIFPPAIGGPVLFRVRVGSFASREEAEATAQRLSASGMSPQILENR